MREKPAGNNNANKCKTSKRHGFPFNNVFMVPFHFVLLFCSFLLDFWFPTGECEVNGELGRNKHNVPHIKEFGGVRIRSFVGTGTEELYCSLMCKSVVNRRFV